MAASDVVANAAFTALTNGVDFDIDVPDMGGAEYQLPATTGPLYTAVTKLTNADLTTGVVDGAGTFDVLMTGFKAHLTGEFKANRISGAEYTKAFIALTEGAMSNAVQFLLGKDTAYWQALAAQVQAQIAGVQLITARVGLAIAKVELQKAQTDAQLSKATYALTKMKLATEGVAYDTGLYNLNSLLPQQLALNVAETNLAVLKVSTETVARDTALYNLANGLPQQVQLVGEQIKLVKEQTEVQRAQTLDNRADGTAITGSVGKQKDLYSQQITSYKRDAEVKAAKIFTDAWITQKSMDEGTLPPDAFNNASLQTILVALKTNNELT
jgi:hypothetical protein